MYDEIMRIALLGYDGRRRKKMDYKFNRGYFEKIPWFLLSFIGLIGIILLFYYFLIGFLILLVVGAFLFYKLYGKPKDGDMDLVYEEQAQLAIQRGFEKLGIRAGSAMLMDPIVIHGPLIDKISFEPVVFKGRDNIVRSSNYGVVVFYFGEEQVYYYHHTFSVIDDEVNEVFGELFYKDIVSISTATITTPYFDAHKRKERFFKQNIFEMTTSGGFKIKCPIQDLARVENHLEGMKDILRKRKNVS